MLSAMNAFIGTLFGTVLVNWFASEVMLYLVSVIITATIIKFVIAFVRK